MNLPVHRPPGPTVQLEENVGTRFLTLRETAAFLNVHPNTVRSQVQRGELPGAKIGRGWRFLEADLVAWTRSRYPRPARTIRRAGEMEELWRPAGLKEIVPACPRQITERALDALLEHPAPARRGSIITG
jgi:excisionase family DNA binding protein